MIAQAAAERLVNYKELDLEDRPTLHLHEAVAFRAIADRKSSELSALRMTYYTAAMLAVKGDEAKRMNDLAFGVLGKRETRLFPWLKREQEEQDWSSLGDAGLTKRYERAFGAMNSPQMVKNIEWAHKKIAESTGLGL